MILECPTTGEMVGHVGTSFMPINYNILTVSAAVCYALRVFWLD